MVFEELNYIITIAYLILVYLAAEYFGGNGPIAALFLGLILNNSKQLSDSFIEYIANERELERAGYNAFEVFMKKRGALKSITDKLDPLLRAII